MKVFKSHFYPCPYLLARIEFQDYLQINKIRIGVPGSSILKASNYRESEDGKVYVYNEKKAEEILFYDFKMLQGDTLERDNNTYNFIANEVDSITTLDGISRRVLKSYNNEIIEGIGQNHTAFFDDRVTDVIYATVCFYVNKILVHDFKINTLKEFPCGDFGLSSIEEYIRQNQISLRISDNRVYVDGLEVLDYDLVLCNALGQQLGNLESTAGYYDLSHFDLPSGMIVG